MAHEDQSTRFEKLLQLLREHVSDGISEAIQILMNEAMKLERRRRSARVAVQCGIYGREAGHFRRFAA